MNVFKNNDAVEIKGTHFRMDGLKGIVIGIASQHPETTSYIVKFDDKPEFSEWDAVTLPDCYLKRITNLPS